MRAIAIAEGKGAADLIDSMHQLRADLPKPVGMGRRCSAGRKIDDLDSCRASHILAVTPSRQVVGCARLLPATQLTMMSILFPDLEQTGLLRPMLRRSRVPLLRLYLTGNGKGRGRPRPMTSRGPCSRRSVAADGRGTSAAPA